MTSGNVVRTPGGTAYIEPIVTPQDGRDVYLISHDQPGGEIFDAIYATPEEARRYVEQRAATYQGTVRAWRKQSSGAFPEEPTIEVSA